MNKTKKIVILLGAAALFSGCSSSKDIKPVPGDSYIDESEAEVVEGNEDKKEVSSKKTNAVSETTKTKKKKRTVGEVISNGITNFFASKFYEYDQTTLFTGGVFGGIKQRNADNVIYPKNGNAGFGCTNMASYYYITFDATSRKKLEKAVNQYISDFEKKKLDRSNKKSFKIYGSVKAMIFWGTIKSSSPNHATANIYLGYKFENNSPYFSFYMYPAANDAYTGPDSGFTEKSDMLHYYFTKSQALTLVSCLSDERVAEAIRKYEADRYGEPEDSDEYDDYYDEAPNQEDEEGTETDSDVE